MGMTCRFEYIKYGVQVTFGSVLVFFSMYQILRDVDDPAVYYSMLSGTIGLFLPTPGTRSRRTVKQPDGEGL